ncbi:MAG: hypothetical protein C0518_05375 [Opitutus sp.]|nr:hypothetical protein [Opitutus sp.]
MMQLGLQFNAPTTTDQDVTALVDLLAKADAWMSREQIGVALGWNERKVRAVASDCDQVVSYPGSPGYKLVRKCTAEEYQHYRNAMRKQARQMIGRVLRTDRQFYGHPAAIG